MVKEYITLLFSCSIKNRTIVSDVLFKIWQHFYHFFIISIADCVKLVVVGYVINNTISYIHSASTLWPGKISFTVCLLFEQYIMMYMYN